MQPDTFQSLTDVLKSLHDSQQSINFIKGQGQRQQITYSDLLVQSRKRLAQLQAAGLQAGSQLIIQCGDNQRFLEAYWACLLGGIVAVPVATGNSEEHKRKLFRIAEKLNKPGLYTDSTNLRRIEDFARSHQGNSASRLFACRTEVEESLPTEDAARLHRPQKDDVAFIQFSSGSTSSPKGVVLTHQNLLVNTRAIIKGFGMTDIDHMLSWMPLTHDMGLIGFHLTPLVKNVSHSLMPTDLFVRRPMSWLTEAQAIKASVLCSPNFGYQHLLKSFRPGKAQGLDLSAVRLIFNGAEPISTRLCQQFMNTFAEYGLNQDAMYPVYGLAEASLAVTFPRLDERWQVIKLSRRALGVGQQVIEDPDGVEFVAVGEPIDDVSVAIRDENGKSLDEGFIGHICIRGDNVTRGYYEEPALNQQLIDDSGWLDTGDLGFQKEQQLYITGRAKDIIFVAGQNVYPHDLEELVHLENLVERGKLAISSRRAGDEDQVLVFVLHRGERESLLVTARAIVGLLSEQAGITVAAVLPVNRIPKTTSGKIQRYALVADLEAGEIEPVWQAPVTNEGPGTESLLTAEPGSMGEDSTAVKLLALCNAKVEDMTIKPDENLFELGISSLTLAEIHAAIDDEWPGRVDITDLFDYPTVNALAGFLEQADG